MQTFIEVLKAVFLGIVQGITEWLPISSTGHMILADEFIRLLNGTNKDFVDLFLVVIQFGSILAVVTLYFNKLNPFSPKKSAEEKKGTWIMWMKVLVATLPAGVIGLLFDDAIDTYLYNSWIVAAMLIIYGIMFIITESRKREPKVKTISEMSFKTALLIGLFQVLALIPGTSRSGSTILGAVMIGASREISAEFSFFLAIPVMLGASALKILKYVLEGGSFTGDNLIILLTGMVVAYLVSVWAIKFLMGYIRKHDFKAFGYYRIILGVIVIAYFTIRYFTISNVAL